MSLETLLGIWAGICTGISGGLTVVVLFLRNERNAYRRKLDMSEPPRAVKPPFAIERKEGGR